MKKKNILMIALSLCLIAIIAVGGTLAYFTDTTDTKQNVFISGNVNIALTDETKASDGVKAGQYVYDVNNKQTGILYENVLPGDTLSKEVAVTVLDKDLITGRPASSNAHVGILVTVNTGVNNPGADEIYTLVDEAVKRLEANEGDIWSAPERVVVKQGDDQYVSGKFYTYNPYAAGKGWQNGVPAGTKLKLFDDIEIPDSWGNEYGSRTFDIAVQAYAIQADHVVYTELVNAVQGKKVDSDGNTVTFEQVDD